MAFSFNTLLTADMLFSHVAEESIFNRYLGFYPTFGKRFTNPLPGRPKADTNNGCSFFYGSNGRLLFKDWGWRVFDAVGVGMQYYNMEYYAALRQIAKDFGVIADDGQINSVTRPIGQEAALVKAAKGYLPIQIRVRNWTKGDLDFWQLPDRVVTVEELKQARIYSISDYWLDGYWAADHLSCCFAYQLGPVDMFQIYCPKVKNKRYKFRQSSSSWVVNMSHLRVDKYVLVTKSYKDWFVLQLLGFNVCCVLSETVNFQPQQVEKLNSYGKVVLLYDNDAPGIEAAKERAVKHDWQYITYPVEVGKDSWDCAKAEGSIWVQNYLIDLLE